MPTSWKKNALLTRETESVYQAFREQERLLCGFVLIGGTAQTAIDGNTVLVWNDQVPDPQAARYGWAPFPRVNLYNKEGLPASPFSTEPDPK